MKTLWWWVERIEYWREPLGRQLRRFSSEGRSLKYRRLSPKAGLKRLSRHLGRWPLLLRDLPGMTVPPQVSRRRLSEEARDRWQPAVAITLAAVTLTAAMGQRFYRQPELQVGTVAPKTIVAPDDASIEDEETTEAQRSAARNGATPVLVPDPERNASIRSTLDTLLRQASDLRRQAGSLPFTATSHLSTSAQRYVRQIRAEEWQAIWQLVQPWSNPEADMADVAEVLANLRQQTAFRRLSPRQQQVVRELLAYRARQTPAALRTLGEAIATARQNYQQARADLSQLAEQEPGLPDTALLFDLSDTEWVQTQSGIRRAVDRMLQQGIARGVPDDLLRTAVQFQLQGEVPLAAEEFASDLLFRALAPNLVTDPELTRAKAEAAAESVPPVMVSVQAGEPIVRAGETIDQRAFVLLDHFQLSQRRLNITGLLGFGLLTTGGVFVFLMVERTVRPALRRRDHGLILFTLLGVAGLSVGGVAVYSLPAVALLLSSFYGATLGSTVVGVLALLLPIGTRVSTIPLIACATGALVCTLVTPRLRSREELALLGGVEGLIQGSVYLILTWMLNPVSAATWYLPLTGAALQGVYGLLSSVVALGLSPYLEHLFDLVTPIRLAELSNPNRPLLKRLASEAPGTFQHTLFVSSLAEAAAQALGCNVELVRAGTLYHDIGKMHDPQGFIENQMGGPNKHDEINDPWCSAEIIKKHVSQGLVMARRCRLPKALQSFIPEHQGTMLISYFYHQAQERAQADPNCVVREADFRYDGPIPQTPETGIVMLADSCEAALRSLKEATPDEALAMVNRILKARWRDNQLVDSGLTREHMAVIAQVFVQVWQQYNHKRIAYPKASLNPALGKS